VDWLIPHTHLALSLHHTRDLSTDKSCEVLGTLSSLCYDTRRVETRGKKGRMPVTSRVLKVLGLVAIMLLLSSGCAPAGPVRTESQTVALGGAESVHVEIITGTGALLINGGADELMEADFTYSQDSWKPEVEYAVTGSQGTLTVRQPSAVGVVPTPNIRYEWDVRLNNDVPMDLGIQLGVGGGNLDLGDLHLSRLHIGLGVGGAEIDLTGDWQSDLDANIEGGVGGVKVTLPRDVGVRVDVEKGLGGVDAAGFTRDGDAYVNDAYGQSDATLRLNLKVGVGGVELNLAG